MKKIFIPTLFALLINSSLLHAQISKGSWLLGAGFGLSSYHNNSDNNSFKNNSDGFYFSPVVGRDVRENLVFGGGLSFSSLKYLLEQTGTTNTQKIYGYGANIFLRRYKPIGKDFYLFIEGSLGGSYSKSSSSPQGGYNNFKRTSLGLNGTPGIAYAISKKLQLELGLSQLVGLNYFHEKGDKGGSNYNSPYNSNTLTISSSLSNSLASAVNFGFRVLIGK